MSEQDRKEVIEPEVLGPQQEPLDPAAQEPIASVRWRRVRQALVSGLLLDLVDLYSFMPTPPVLLAGAAVGALVGAYMARTQDVPVSQRIWWISLAAVYCALPKTHFYPLAALIGCYRALVRR